MGVLILILVAGGDVSVCVRQQNIEVRWNFVIWRSV